MKQSESKDKEKIARECWYKIGHIRNKFFDTTSFPLLDHEKTFIDELDDLSDAAEMLVIKYCGEKIKPLYEEANKEFLEGWEKPDKENTIWYCKVCRNLKTDSPTTYSNHICECKKMCE